ncbi:MAG: hypothetical protein HY912_20745 [Desulfomonile tiedjei]|uniref:Uncharacterized protein n=1 Tax=Desulfomonile tiedjei TaxID=2358 RepID=A0A9D6V740_9BACT|nr:hypothetical protein [Desulfomonile tiedjei]
MTTSSRRNLIRCIMVGSIVLSGAWMPRALCSLAWAASSGSSQGAGTTSGSGQTTSNLDELSTNLVARTVKELLKDGYAVDGPVEVVEVGQSSITLFKTGEKNWKLDLTGMKVTIKDYQNQTLLLSEIKAKNKVYVCRKKSNVTILVLQKKEGTNDR